jgi:ppGpp synthetase/RelA/SpoT-type nucleotidyltranferase
VLHYLQHGRHEIRLKTYQEIDNELKSSLKQCEEAEAKLKLLETQFDLVKQQLETMKDLFARLADRPQSLQQTKEE